MGRVTLPAPRAVLFDWDNTLVNTWPIIHEALRRTFIAMGQTPWTLEETRQRVAKSMRDSFPELFGDRWEEAGKIYQDSYHELHISQLEALPGAEKLLQKFTEMGLWRAVVSNKKNYNLIAEVPELKWEKYFDALVGSGDAPTDKPFADPVLLALKGSGIEPGPDVWFFGDSVVDLECAKNTGCTPIFFGPDAPEYDNGSQLTFKGFPVSAYGRDHTELFKVLFEGTSA